MKITVASDLVIGAVRMDSLRMSSLIQALGSVRTEEKIALHGGGTRKREVWSDTGVTTLRDEEDEALCLFVDPSSVSVVIEGRDLPTTERDFLRSFPAAQKQIGHVYTLSVEQWLMHIDFKPAQKRRRASSSMRQLSRLTIGRKKEANQ